MISTDRSQLREYGKILVFQVESNVHIFRISSQKVSLAIFYFFQTFHSEKRSRCRLFRKSRAKYNFENTNLSLPAMHSNCTSRFDFEATSLHASIIWCGTHIRSLEKLKLKLMQHTVVEECSITYKLLWQKHGLSTKQLIRKNAQLANSFYEWRKSVNLM